MQFWGNFMRNCAHQRPEAQRISRRGAARQYVLEQAPRGIDVAEISPVIIYDMPDTASVNTYRISRAKFPLNTTPTRAKHAALSIGSVVQPLLPGPQAYHPDSGHRAANGRLRRACF
jgi:hypothetical protein